MHPIERLRHVARAEGVGPSAIAREAACALAAFGSDPAGLVTACRRLVDRHPAVGPMWWAAARILAASDPAAEARRSADELDSDPTPDKLAARVPAEGRVTVLGWPEHAGWALRRTGGLELYVIDVAGQWSSAIDRLERAGLEPTEVPESGLGAAVASSTLVILEADALGPNGFIAAAGSRAAASVARAEGIPVWLVAGRGRVLPKRLWEALVRRFEVDDEPWLAEEEVVPLSLVDCVVGPAGTQSPEEAVRRADCPVAPELLRMDTEKP